ncbi:MAG: glycosyltransferase family 4 protein [Planctomycetia bacterium]|nr:glycosyltransferase family 4 protein [Planctomycetia bacterium]
MPATPHPTLNRPLRVAVASSGLGRIFRGVEAWANDLAKALNARGEDVTLFKGGGKPGADYEEVVPCLEQGSDRIRRFRSWLPRGSWRLGLGSEVQVEQTTFALNLIRRLRKKRIDVLHVQDAQVAVVAQWAKRLGLIRTATILGHGTEESLDFQKRIGYLQHLAPWHLEQSRTAGAWRPEWTAIPNFIDTDLFGPGRADDLRAELGIPADHLIVMTASAIKRHHKRVDYLLSEFARLLAARPELPVTLVIAGGREADTDELIALGRESLGDRVRFLVRFPRDRMPALYRAADIFVLGSLFEMMPLAILEATASQLPCLVNRHPVLEWMVGPGGRPLDMSLPGTLASELAKLCDDAPARIALGQVGREHCLANFGRDAVVDQITAYYRFVVAHQKSPRKALRASA